jgi:hypothetical protein
MGCCDCGGSSINILLLDQTSRELSWPDEGLKVRVTPAEIPMDDPIDNERSARLFARPTGRK